MLEGRDRLAGISKLVVYYEAGGDEPTIQQGPSGEIGIDLCLTGQQKFMEQ
jgi:hypothetical protein